MKVTGTQQVEVNLDIRTQYEVTKKFIRDILDFPSSWFVYEGKLYQSPYDCRGDDELLRDATEDDLKKYEVIKYIEQQYRSSK